MDSQNSNNTKMKAPQKPSKNEGDNQEFSDEEEAVAAEGEEKKPKRAGTERRGGGWGGGSGICCQAEKCGLDLTEAKRYHRRHKVCEFHAKAPSVLVCGLRQRFCQQCSRFHELSEFDEAKRSCRRRLAGHNERRRKSAEAQGEGGSGTGSSSRAKSSANPQCRPADHVANRAQMTTYPNSSPTSNYKHFQIR